MDWIVNEQTASHSLILGKSRRGEAVLGCLATGQSQCYSESTKGRALDSLSGNGQRTDHSQSRKSFDKLHTRRPARKAPHGKTQPLDRSLSAWRIAERKQTVSHATQGLIFASPHIEPCGRQSVHGGQPRDAEPRHAPKLCQLLHGSLGTSRQSLSALTLVGIGPPFARYLSCRKCNKKSDTTEQV